VQKPRLFILSLVSGLLLSAPAAYPFSLDGLEILRISSREQAAVIKTDDTGVRLVRVGDPIGTDGRVVRIDSNVLVIREDQDGQAVTAIIRLEDGRQTIRTVRDIGDRRPALYQPLKTGRERRP
jgi:hypothetical protein